MKIIFISRFLINLPTSLCIYISFQLHLYWIILCLWLKYLHIKDKNLLYHQEDMCLDSVAWIVVITIHWPIFRLYSLCPHIIYFWFSLHVEYSIQMSLLFPLSYGCDDQNIMSITTKRHREIMHLIGQEGWHLSIEHQVSLYLWQLPLTDAAVLWKVTLFSSWLWGKLLWCDDSWWVVEMSILPWCLGNMSHSQPIEPLCFLVPLSPLKHFFVFKVQNNSRTCGRCDHSNGFVFGVNDEITFRKLHSATFMHMCNCVVSPSREL